MLRGEAGKLRVVPGHGGTGGITLPYRPREPLKVFVQWNGGVQGAFGKSPVRAAWGIGWKKRDTTQEEIHAIGAREEGPRKCRFLEGRRERGSPPKGMDSSVPIFLFSFPVSQTPIIWEPGVWTLPVALYSGLILRRLPPALVAPLLV